MAEIPFLPGSLEPQDKFDQMADEILHHDHDPEGYVDALIQRLQEES